MSNTPSPNPSNPLADIIANYLQAVERGESPDRDVLLAAHPERADELKAFFADHDRMLQMVDSPTILPTSVFDAPTGPFQTEVPAIGTKVRYLGDYKLLEEIARGGMGVVYKARQISLNRIVALKMILSGQLTSADDVQRFRSEAEAAANLDHPHIVPIYEVGEHEGQHYFSMKLIEGGSLGQAKEKKPTLGSKQQQRWLAQLVATVARAVHHAHQRGILHRDLKPGNILLDAQGQPHITDFGLAKKVEGGSDVTHTGVIIGTPSYMAPEQARSNKGLTTAVDVYSLGAVLYELLTGQAPFKAATPLDTILEVLEKEPIKPRSIIPAIDRDLETIVLKCLEKDQARRYGSAEALAEELERWIKGEPIIARPVGQFERSWRWCQRNPVVASLCGCVVLALLAGIIASSIFAHDASLRAEAEAKARNRAELSETSLNKSLLEAESNLYFNRIKLAHQYWHRGDLPRVEQLLNECQPSQRRWEWNYLNRLGHSEHLLLPNGKTRSQTLHFSKDGMRMASVATSGDVGVTVWNLKSNPPTKKVIPLQSTPKAGTLSSDGLILALIDVTGTITLWDAATGKMLKEFARLKEDISRLTFSADGKLLAGGSKIWDVSSGHEVYAKEGMTAWCFSPDGKWLLVANERKSRAFLPQYTNSLIDVVTFNEHLQLGSISGFAFDQNGDYLAFGMEGQARTTAIRIIDPASGNVRMPDITPELDLQDSADGKHVLVALSPDHKFLATSSEYLKNVEIWKVTDRKRPILLRGHTQNLSCLVFSPDGKWLVTGSSDKTLKFWSPSFEQEVSRVSKLSAYPITDATFDSEGRRIVSIIGDHGSAPFFVARVSDIPLSKIVTVTDVQSGKTVQTLRGHSSGIRRVASAGNQIVASGDSTGEVRICDASNSKHIVSYKESAIGITCVALSSDGKWAASSQDAANNKKEELRQQAQDASSVVHVWNAQTGVEHYTLRGHRSVVGCVAFSHDGSRLASASENQIKLWDLTNGKELFELERLNRKHINCTRKMVFSPNGELLACPSGEEILLWDARTGKYLRALQSSGESGEVAFTHDGLRLVTAHTDEAKLTIWDLISGQEILTLPFPKVRTNFEFGVSAALKFSANGATSVIESNDGGVIALTFTSNDCRLLAVMRDGPIIQWDAVPTSSASNQDK